MVRICNRNNSCTISKCMTV